MIYNPLKVIAKVQNLCIECDGDSQQYCSNTHEYDYAVSGLSDIKSIAKECMMSSQYQAEHISGIVLKKGIFLICYLNKDRKNNPYLFIYDKNKDRVRNIAYINELKILKNKNLRDNIQYKIKDTIFMDNVFLICQDQIRTKAKAYDEFIEQLDKHIL